MAKALTTEEFDRRFDEGEDIFDLVEIRSEDISRPGLETRRINIDLPIDFLVELDREAARRGITRQSLIKVWLYDHLHGRPARHWIVDMETGEYWLSGVERVDKEQTGQKQRPHRGRVSVEAIRELMRGDSGSASKLRGTKLRSSTKPK